MPKSGYWQIRFDAADYQVVLRLARVYGFNPKARGAIPVIIRQALRNEYARFHLEEKAMSIVERARQRVEDTPELLEYVDIIIDYDWHEGDEHFEWVINAPVAEILSWAQGIREDESTI